MPRTSRLLIEFDAASDAAQSYVRAPEDGLGDEEALQVALAESLWDPPDPDRDPLAVVGIANAMAERGRLTPPMRADGLEALAGLAAL